ncbi:hypothetical protein PY650_35800 [Rhizobium calliandrae]|uniref:Uncharacterized protein n=1 Tax=Rhizobium calliandrae TaxID=1312182 RepID=A0ABT7KQ93_9HYPH|nr:hypothetical protein [Rhizobium calliandrae]MDL2410814.1 hypothetical protein [Rhizobium calliandrae]
MEAQRSFERRHTIRSAAYSSTDFQKKYDLDAAEEGGPRDVISTIGTSGSIDRADEREDDTRASPESEN